MAPLELSTADFVASPRPRPVDQLMRALLYTAQQLGRPVTEAELRGLAALPHGPLETASFLLAARRLGFDAQLVPLARMPLAALPMPFVIVGRGRGASVVLSVTEGQAAMLDVVDGRIVHLAVDAVMASASEALILRDPLAGAPVRTGWHAPIWSALRPAIAEIAAVSFAVNLLALASPLFMMV